MSSRRVAVTGIGLLTALGNDLNSCWEAIRQGRSGISRTKLFDASGFRQRSAAEVKNFEPRNYFRFTKLIKIADRKTRLAVAAATMALDDAGLGINNQPLDRTFRAESSTHSESLGVLMGTGASDLDVKDMARAIGEDPELRSAFDVSFFASKVLSGINPLWLLINLPNMVSTHIAIQIGAHGPNSTIMTDWIAAAQAVGEAAALIEAGEADLMLAGGADSSVYALAFASCQQAGLFDGSADLPPFTIGEGAAVLLLEERDRALERGGRIYAELNGYSCASFPVNSPEPGSALEAALEDVLQQAGWHAANLDAICCASVFSERHRNAERAALEKAFHSRAGTLPLVEYKSAVGHTLAASGAVDLALLLKHLHAIGKPARAVCNSLGYLGQAAAVAVSVN
ncbi:MAG TPA: beta-ketoacyl synthase N-terminal-like domain-containing protein [Acidobacteriota bacterium]